MATSKELKKKAHSAIYMAIYRGERPAPTLYACRNCGEQATDYHHHKGYKSEFWNDVIPLCRSCHQLETLEQSENEKRLHLLLSGKVQQE